MCGLRLAAFLQRATFAALRRLRTRQGLRQLPAGQHVPNRLGCLCHVGAQLRRDGHNPAAFGAGVVQRAFGYGLAGHGLQAQGLRGQLQVVAGGNVGSLVAAAVFVFDGVGHASGQKFHHVGLANQPQRVVPQRQGALHAHAFGGVNARQVGLGMHRLAAQSGEVVIKHLLQVDQTALARAVAPVLQGRQGNGFGFWRGGCSGHGRYGFLGALLAWAGGMAFSAFAALGAFGALGAAGGR